MSNFAGQQYYTPAAHSLPNRHLPLSPPETDHDAYTPPGADLDGLSAGGHYLGSSNERSRLQPRKTSTLSYQNSGARDLRDRGNPRSPRNLVVVIPPQDFPLEQGHLGNVLSMGPRHRLTQGILMPLFPTMFGQLNAIAREYNFPSTMGLCLYLHINENGITMTPRISDDSWQYLFGHLFDARPTSNGYQLPIGGSIEFDVDLNKARWFDSWVSGTFRDPDPVVAPSRASSVTRHWRGESRTTNADEQSYEERWEAFGSQTLHANSRPETLRHVPRKLSLVDRLDSQATLLEPKVHHQPESHLPHALSPIPQSAAIPQATKSDLECRVNSWRESAELFPVSMTEAYQPAADVGVPSVMPAMEEYALDRKFRPELNLDEFHWSVSSTGPNDPMTRLPVPSRPPSVHIDRRATGSIPPTPVTVTSWGPGDDDWCSVVSTISRLPSPDLGERIIEDAEAPRPPAIWGNSFGWRTMTTWQAVYPYSVTHAKPMIEVLLRDSRGLVSVYPNLVIYPPVSPDLECPTATQAAVPVQLRSAGGLEPKYPNMSIYPAVYPSLEIYPLCTVEDVSQHVSVALRESAGLAASYSNLVIYPTVYPHLDIYPWVTKAVGAKAVEPIDTKLFSSTSLLGGYPNFVIYPAVYPHFDLYQRALEVAGASTLKEVAVRLVDALSPSPEYPNLVIYPSVYPYFDIYPAQETRKHTSSAVWSVSFGWKSAKTWLNVYPHQITTKQYDSDDNTSMVKIMKAERFDEQQAVWGTSFGWNNAATWRTVWPTSSAQLKSLPIQLAGPGGLPSEYPHLIIYPSTYPHFDIYPARVDTAEAQDSQTADDYEQPVALIPHYPNLTIYPATYPHLDVYPPFAKASVTPGREKGRGNLRRRRIEAWRAKTAAQVNLAGLLTNNHNWEADEPLELNPEDYAWSATSAGPSTSIPLQLRTPYYPPSVHLDRRVVGSVILTPSTATTWGPKDDDDWYSDIASTERLPSPDVAQRVFDDSENPFRNHRAWRLVWPFLREDSGANASVLEAHYPNLLVYPAAYPHFDLYPAWIKPSVSEHSVTESLTRSTRCPVVFYPHFNIYPPVDVPIEVRMPSDGQDDRVEVRLPTPYPNLDIYPAGYPYNLDCIYPAMTVTESAQLSVAVASSYPWLVIYPPVYPFVTPYPSFAVETEQPSKPPQPLPVSLVLQSVTVRFPGQYPTFDLYPAGYPSCLESIYPAISVYVDECSASIVLPPLYPCIEIYPSVYPFLQPYPQTAGMGESTRLPGSLDKAGYTHAQGLLALAEYKSMDPYRAGYPHFDLYPALTTESQQTEVAPSRPPSTTRRERKTHMELHVCVFRSLEKQPAQQSKKHLQLHDEVFRDGVVWTPSGYMQDLTALTPRKQEKPPVREQRRRSPPPPISDLASAPLHTTRSRSGTLTQQSPDNVVFPLGQPAALPPLPPLRVRSPGVSSQPSPAVSETPMPRASPPSTHTRSPSSRLTQAVKSIMPGVQRRNSSAALRSPPADEPKERAKDHQPPTRFLSMVDRRPQVVPPLPHTSTAELLSRAPQGLQRRESLVLQRARAYEQANGEA